MKGLADILVNFFFENNTAYSRTEIMIKRVKFSKCPNPTGESDTLLIFCFLSFHRDGMISKAEMKKYFFTANYHSLRNSFKHDFHEYTYSKPTFCIHCTGVVSTFLFCNYSPDQSTVKRRAVESLKSDFDELKAFLF